MGQTVCSGACRTLASDDAHCGACGNACTTGQRCINSTCVQAFTGAGRSWSANGRVYGRFTWSEAGTSNNGRANAEAACVARGGTLARPNSQAEWDAIRDNILADTQGWWIDGHNNFICGNATPGAPKTYQYGLMYTPTGQSSMYTGCNCTMSEMGLVVYRFSGNTNFDGCTGTQTATGNMGIMDEQLSYSHPGIVGFICVR
jgi:hypothetical protein